MRPSWKAGFTLVELLIVVAIIGVLSTIGVPTYRRMIQKSKKAEAVQYLGALYTTESAFLAEFGNYGSNLLGIGFEVEGLQTNNSHSGRYAVGFPFGNCYAAILTVPALITPQGIRLNQIFPGYYQTFQTVFVPQAHVGSTTAFCRNASMSGASNLFIATASGVISPKFAGDSSTSSEVDQWTMNQDRTLSNVVDGIN